jgi:hypothetical protein
VADSDHLLGKAIAGLLFGGAAMLVARAFGNKKRKTPPAVVARKVGPVTTKRAKAMTTQALIPGLAGGILLRNVQAGSYEAPQWVDVPLGDMIVTVASDNLKSSPDGVLPAIRLPVTWFETVSIAQLLGASLGEDMIAPSQKIVDALHAAASIKTSFPSQGTGAMMALATSQSYNRDVDQLIAKKGAAPGDGALISGHEKYWILHPRLSQAVNDATLRANGLPLVGPNPAVNYGAWDTNGRIIQTVGGRHNSAHYDESQLYRPTKRWARKSDGTKVDLLVWIEQSESVPSEFTDLFRPQLAA